MFEDENSTFLFYRDVRPIFKITDRPIILYRCMDCYKKVSVPMRLCFEMKIFNAQVGDTLLICKPEGETELDGVYTKSFPFELNKFKTKKNNNNKKRKAGLACEIIKER